MLASAWCQTFIGESLPEAEVKNKLAKDATNLDGVFRETSQKEERRSVGRRKQTKFTVRSRI